METNVSTGLLAIGEKERLQKTIQDNPCVISEISGVCAIYKDELED